MIYIGLTGWGDHDDLYTAGIKSGEKLKEYAGHFPIVEVDSSFYAIQPIKNSEKWVTDTPGSFQFIIKAYQGMTLHLRGEIPFETREKMFRAFRESLKPYLNHSKLATVLFQFPPWFECKKENVEYLRWCREQMADLPVSLEFRHQSWFTSKYKERTLAFMESENWIHSICDEPQAGAGSVPTVIHPTTGDKTIVRFHGRNIHGWNRPNEGNWREVRYLYNYNEHELLQWVNHLNELKKKTDHIYVLFNNNSGGDAANNAKHLMELLKVDYDDLAPRQLNLF
ncbi:DUF72 domain-containing protein [Litchfieldia alkalitelluris]|uniref:DUF72 domain-containing protein n=1 Tax=Litchfieldia alkalitelluris TaxID=304268 RepID=UPI0009982C6B|nr:DUF72 domain-containing protein [Litchfieldia alkalitelluris]